MIILLTYMCKDELNIFRLMSQHGGQPVTWYLIFCDGDTVYTAARAAILVHGVLHSLMP